MFSFLLAGFLRLWWVSSGVSDYLSFVFVEFFVGRTIVWRGVSSFKSDGLTWLSDRTTNTLGLILWKIPRFVFVAVVNSASVVKTSRPGQRGAAVLLGFLFGSSLVVCSAALRGFYGHRLLSNFIASVLRCSKRLILVLSRSLQFMTQHSGLAFVLVVAFLATAVALNVGLVGCPFRFRLRSFVLLSFSRTFVVGTWLA